MNRILGKAGFTLVEALTAITLASFVSAMTFPVAATLAEQYRLRSASDQLASEIAGARMQAVGQNVFVRIQLLQDGQYVRQRSTDGANYVQDGAVLSLPGGIVATAGSTGAPSFDRLGLAPVSTAITVGNSRGQKTVQTNILGRVTVT